MELKKELIACVRSTIGPFAAPDTIHWAPSLPKTRSGWELELGPTEGLDNVILVLVSGADGDQLLQFVGHQMDGERELVDSGPLTSQIEDTDLGIGHTPVKSRLGVGLVLAITVASRGPPTHFGSLVEVNQAILA